MRKLLVTTLSAGLVLSACLHSGESEPPPDQNQSSAKLSGVVLAPGGSLAFNKPGGFETFFASLFGKTATAAISGMDPVGGVPVKLYKVDATGATVGDAIAEGKTALDGTYSLNIADDFAPGIDYVVRAIGTTETMDARVLDTTVDVDPVSYVTHLKIKELTSAKGDLSVVDLNEAKTLFGEITRLLDFIDEEEIAAAGSVSGLRTRVENRMSADEELSYLFSNLNAAEGICGTVADSDNTPAQGVLVVARDFGNWVTRNRIRTDADGKYCLNVIPGDYILGVINDTTTNSGATEWWATSGTAYSQIDGEKITVATASSLTKNFQLEAGGRISGTVTGTGGSYDGVLPNVKVFVRNFQTYFSFGGAQTNANGKYALNVIPGDYMLLARNNTRFHYASAFFDGTNNSAGGINRFAAAKIALATGATETVDFSLERGFLIKGTVFDNNTTPVAGQRVRFQIQGPADRIRTNKDGNYRLWVKAGSYGVQSRGQNASGVTVNSTTPVKTVDFAASTGSVSGVIKDSSGTPVSQAKIFLLRANGTGFIGNELSNSDGSFTVFSDTAGVDLTMLIRIDDGRDYGSMVFNGSGYNRAAGTAIIVATDGTDTDLGTISLPTGGILTGTVTKAGSPAVNASISISQDGTNVFLTLNSLSDGSYTISVPATTYSSITATKAGVVASADNVVVTAGGTATADIAIP
ncbi:MAG: hypothetical protein OEZ43_16640 [Gammaproteobacteria bacterium]|nr:hypothetical protein [Gammaproteobacteria bacterium]